MNKILQERDDVVATHAVSTSDGRKGFVEQVELRRLFSNAHDGTTEWSQPVTWYRFNGIEVSLQDDGTWVLSGTPDLVLTSR